VVTKTYCDLCGKTITRGKRGEYHEMIVKERNPSILVEVFIDVCRPCLEEKGIMQLLDTKRKK
jgi:hypothetical protein